MKVWLLKDGENLPIEENVSKMRTWMLAEELVSRGHEVVWWSSTHSHQRKALLRESDCTENISTGFQLRLLASGSYKSNRSYSRFRHHRTLANRFLRTSASAERPDIIVASFPNIDFAHAGNLAALSMNCPSVVDIRDPWPDVAYNLYDGLSRSIAKSLLSPMTKKASDCLALATSLYACSDGFLNWGLQKAGRIRSVHDRVFYIGRPATVRKTTIETPDQWSAATEGKILIAFVGSFGNVYELELVCEAAKLLSESGEHHYHFVLAGDGDKAKKLKKICSGLDNVSLPGWISSSSANSLLRGSAIGLAPYRQLPGCLPNKVCEYLAMGLPIVSSLEGDMEGLLEEFGAGYSYKPGDVAGLVQAIRNATQNNASLDKLSEGAKSLFESKFDATQIYSQFAESLENVVQGR